MAVLLATPAATQGPEGEPIYKTREGQGFELFADGTLIIGGDVVGSCETLVREARPKPVKPDREFLRQIEACEEAGFRVPGSEYLPETGGPSLPMVAALERVMNFERALLGSDCGGGVAAWKGLEHRWALRAGCG